MINGYIFRCLVDRNKEAPREERKACKLIEFDSSLRTLWCNVKELALKYSIGIGYRGREIHVNDQYPQSFFS